MPRTSKKSSAATVGLSLFGVADSVPPPAPGWVRIAGLGRMKRLADEVPVSSPCGCASGAPDAAAVQRYAERVRAGERLDMAVCKAEGCPQRKLPDEIMALAYPKPTDRYAAYSALRLLCEAAACLRRPGDERASYLTAVRAKRGDAATEALHAAMLGLAPKSRRARA